ncbi:hypothetical protein OAV62_02185, partial [bacterium]|nr:hypothetical protein [bacterium]
TCNHPIETKVLSIEYIDESIPFSDFFTNDKIEFKILVSIIKQVLVAVIMAQTHNRFVHYDLHSNNIMMKKCDKDLTHVYTLHDGTIIRIPTYGWIPIIIDYGFSRSDDIYGNPMYNSLNFSDVGFLYPVYDALADAKLFLITICEELKQSGRAKQSKHVQKFRNIIKNIFSELKVDWDCGWDCEDESIIVKIYSYMEGDCAVSETFTTYPYYAMDILQSLIYLPFNPVENISYQELQKGLVLFLDEFVKIEKLIDDPFYSLYTLHHLVRTSRTLHEMYINDDTRNPAISQFETNVCSILESIDIDVGAADISFEVMLCALFVLREQLEGKIVDMLDKRVKLKNDEYSNMEVTSTSEIFSIIDSIFPLTEDLEKVCVFDATKNKNFYLGLEDIEAISTNGLMTTMEKILNEPDDESN